MSKRKRNVSIQFYLNTREADLLDRKVKATGLSRTVFLRHLVNGFQPRELPPPDYRDLMNALYGIGRNLNQIAQKAHAPVVVAAIRGSEQIMRRTPWRATDVYLDFCGVMDAETIQQHKTHEIGEVVGKWILDSVNT